MPVSGSFTDEGGGFASFLQQVQKSYVPERDVDGRKFDKAMSRLRARVEETAIARAEMVRREHPPGSREDEERIATVLTGVTGIRFLAYRALQAVEYRRQSLWNFSQIVTTLYDIDGWSRRMFDAVDGTIKDTPPASKVAASYLQSLCDGTRTFPVTIEANSRYVMARHLSRISNEINLREMRDFGRYFYRAAPALVSAASVAGVRRAMQKYVTAFQLPRSSVGMNYLELGIAAEEMKLWVEQSRNKFTLQGIAQVDQFLSRHDSIMAGSPTWQKLKALAARPEATFERTSQLVALAKPILTEIKNLSSIQFSSNIDMYLGFRLRAAEKLVQTFPHGPENVSALAMVMNDFVFAIRDILLFMAKSVVQHSDQPFNPAMPLAEGAPSRPAVAATVTFFRLIEGAARELAGYGPDYFGWLGEFYAELDELPEGITAELLAFSPRR